MAVALAALFFAMTGMGIAAKSMITGKQIKNGTVTSKDLAKGAVKAKNLADSAVTPAALADSAVTADKLAGSSITARAIDGSLPARSAGRVINQGSVPKICPGGIITFGAACPAIPERANMRYAEVLNFDSWYALQGLPCSGSGGDLPLTSISQSPDLAPYPGLPTTGDRFTIEKTGNYTVTVNATWDAGPGDYRAIQADKHLGSGPNQGESVKIGYVIDAPAPGLETMQSGTFDFTANAGDTIHFSASQCGPNMVKLQELRANVLPEQAVQ